MFIEPPPESEELSDLRDWCRKLQRLLLEEDLHESVTWDPGSIANGAEAAKNVTIPGVVLGDYAIASFSLDVTDLQLDAEVVTTNIVTCVLSNNTGGAVDLGEGTLYVRVFRRTT